MRPEHDPAATAADEELRRAVAEARALARAPVSGFAVGAAARGGSGAVYPGANLEFPGLPLGATVHAEQAAIANAWAHGETSVSALAVSAAPCGHCRQFLNELRDARELRVLIPGRDAMTLGELLPEAFGPDVLGTTERLLDEAVHRLQFADPAAVTAIDPLPGAALSAATTSYAPYSGTLAGLALALADGSIVAGRSAENAAYNPGLPPLQAALIALAVAGTSYDAIARAVLVETAGSVSHQAASAALLAAVAPATRLTYLRATAAP